MTEFEQCMLMTLKEIKSQLSDIAGGLQYVGNELAQLNENHDVDWTHDIHNDLTEISDSLSKMYTIMDQHT